MQQSRIVSRTIRLFALIAPLAVTSCFLLPKEEDVLAPPLAEPPQITYSTQAVERGDLQDTIRAFGTFVSGSQSDLFFDRRGGRIKDIYIAIDDDVQAGQLVADLFTDTLEGEIAQAELNLRRAEIAKQRAVEQASNQFSLEFARADRDLARLRLQKLQDQLQTELDLAKVTGGESATVHSLREQIAEQEINVRKAELSLQQIQQANAQVGVELAEIDLQSSRLRIEQLRAELDATRLYAPINGTVTWISRTAQEGENIQAFQPFIRLADPTDLVFEYQGRDATSFDVGMKCTVSIRDDTYPGTVILTPRSVPFDQREEYQDTVRIRLDSKPDELRLGTNATAELILAERNNVLVLPKRAVQRYATRRYVHVLVNGVRVERDVEVGLETATEVEIVGGLEEGEQVILR